LPAAGGPLDELGLAPGGWMGSLTALLLRALFDTALTVNNVVVKLLAPAAAATLTCKSMRVVTSPDAWRDALGVPPAITSPLGPHAQLGALRGSSWDAPWVSARNATCCGVHTGLRACSVLLDRNWPGHHARLAACTSASCGPAALSQS